MTEIVHIVIGASGAIGSAIVTLLANNHDHTVYAFSRSKQSFKQTNVISKTIHFDSDETIRQAAESIQSVSGQVHSIFIASGILHQADIKPERSLQQITMQQCHQVFQINTFAPLIIAKYFLPLINPDVRTTFAAISARIGSISDNRLGGWYTYRASKAALNMLLKTLSIEAARKYKRLIVAGLHPGTVDSYLSKPFQKNIPDKQLFSPEHSANLMLNVLNQLTTGDSGHIYAYDGQHIPP